MAAVGTSSNDVYTINFVDSSSLPHLAIQGHTPPTARIAYQSKVNASILPSTICVSTHPSEPVCMTGGLDGTIRKVDLESCQRVGTLVRLGVSVTSMDWGGPLVAVGCAKGATVILDAATLAIASTGSADVSVISMVSCVRFNKEGDYVASAGISSTHHSHQAISILCVRGRDIGKPPTELESAMLEGVITSLDWSDDGVYIQGGTDMCEMVYWNVKTGHILDKTDEQPSAREAWEALCSRHTLAEGNGKLEWNTWTVPGGYPLLGAHADTAGGFVTTAGKSWCVQKNAAEPFVRFCVCCRYPF